jgi:uncharacterized protein involved in oxidation of intracellular sulfur
MSKILFILNDAPYGTERSYQGLRLAGNLGRREENTVRVFLMGDAAACAKGNQKVPTGFYNVETMLKAVTRHERNSVGVCGTCMDARGIGDTELAEGSHRGTLDELAEWTAWADKVLVF